MSISEKTYALIAKDSYKQKVVRARVNFDGDDYEVIATSRPSATGFQATAYQQIRGSELVIAYRGTEFDREPLKDGVVDAAMVLAGINPQAKSAESFTREVMAIARDRDGDSGGRTNISVTGHSLGGTLAQLNAAKFGLDGHTFNAYGAQNLAPDLHEGRGRIVNHCRAGDPVCAAADHIGTVKVYATQGDIDRLKLSGYTGHDRQSHFTTVKSVDFAAHGIENFVDGNAINGASILGPESQARYRANQSLVEMYRSDIHFIRARASASWEIPDAIGREIHGAASRAATHVGHAAGGFASDVGTGARHVFDDAARFGRAMGETAHDAGERTQDYVAGRVHAVGNDLRDAGDVVGERAREAARFAAFASPLTSPVFRDAMNTNDTFRQPPRIDDPAHPDHAMFKNALFNVHYLDREVGRQPDQLSTNLAASLTAAARQQGMSRIDYVELSEDASRAYAVQGDDKDPHKKVAAVATELGIAASVEQSSATWRQAAERQAQAQTMVATPSLSEPTKGHAGPSFSR
ncbi:Protein of unknown function [Luteibacter sp. UNCMF331Sha3.1]|uniref:XVIPCD domain-containing protein n=1 Tax=Luteibacter sp. UNCMF331Sha3.1 TaxID=1502760 RepID=UPI0008B0F114|nr:XVIPCD domain-containing protein [Luteibacter sp. UNCMF331Sha3.1]SEM95668.1 Protein of unknown function [Luteibacter sp. UNCMF331Sha3.1]